MDTVRKGDIYGTTAQDFWGMGYLAGKYLYMNAHGMDVSSSTDTGVILVTKENIDTYADDRTKQHDEWRAEAPYIVKQATAK